MSTKLKFYIEYKSHASALHAQWWRSFAQVCIVNAAAFIAAVGSDRYDTDREPIVLALRGRPDDLAVDAKYDSLEYDEDKQEEVVGSDNHSFGWLTTDEFAAIATALKQSELDAALAAMKSLQEGWKVRAVFWLIA